MKKIPSLFERNRETVGPLEKGLVREEVVPGSEWVTNGEGVATAKWDGTACLVKDGILYKRYDAKNGRTPPPNFVPAQDADPVTGHWPGWVAVGLAPDEQWHREAAKNYVGHLADGTYELIGPKIGRNPHGLVVGHRLIPHNSIDLPNFPRDYVAIWKALNDLPYEGVVWHHKDGRMVKIKRKDFGLPWPVPGRVGEQDAD